MDAKGLITPVFINNTSISVGDTVYLQGVGIPNILFAAFLGRIETGELRFLIPKAMASILGLTGLFWPEDLTLVERDKEAELAIPIESGAGYFPWFPVIVKETRKEGLVIAALSGRIAVIIGSEISEFGAHELDPRNIQNLFAP